MRASGCSETIDILIQRNEEIEALQRGENLRCWFYFRSPEDPKTKLVLRCREEAKQNPDQLLFSWFDDYRKTQPLIEPGWWIETAPEKPDYVTHDPLLDGSLPIIDAYQNIPVTLSKKRLDQLIRGKLEDNCLLTRCIFDRMQIRYYP